MKNKRPWHQGIHVIGKHVGNFFGIAPPTGHYISYQAVHIHTIGEDRKIVEHRAIRDDLAFMMQLGVVGPSSTQYEPLFQAWKGFMRSQQIFQPPTSKSFTDDKAAICALYFQMIDGWNKRSGDAFAAPFAEDGDLVGFDGTHLKGRQEIGVSQPDDEDGAISSFSLYSFSVFFLLLCSRLKK